MGSADRSGDLTMRDQKMNEYIDKGWYKYEK